MDFFVEVFVEVEMLMVLVLEFDFWDFLFVMFDFVGVCDLDQVFYLECDGDGYFVCYVIVDVFGFVVLGGVVDVEVCCCGQILYVVDGIILLYLLILSEDCVLLLFDVDCFVFVWMFIFDFDGVVIDFWLQCVFIWFWV